MFRLAPLSCPSSSLELSYPALGLWTALGPPLDAGSPAPWRRSRRSCLTPDPSGAAPWRLASGSCRRGPSADAAASWRRRQLACHMTSRAPHEPPSVYPILIRTIGRTKNHKQRDSRGARPALAHPGGRVCLSSRPSGPCCGPAGPCDWPSRAEPSRADGPLLQAPPAVSRPSSLWPGGRAVLPVLVWCGGRRGALVTGGARLAVASDGDSI